MGKYFLVAAMICIVCGGYVVVAKSGDQNEAIKAAALDYAEGWYAGDAARMESCLHPDLAKRTVKIDKASGNAVLDELTAGQLVEYTKAGYGKQTPDDKQLKEVTILDVMGNAATVKLEMAGWVDYMHLANMGDRWVIVNVLWEPKPGN
jgi:hypothetical protein